jgi:hypothetical protein
MWLILATFVVVFGRAIQSQNVIGGHYLAAAVTPYGIAVGEVLSVLMVVDVGWSAIPYVGTGGALGAVAAMWVHRWVVRRGRTSP